MVGLLWGWWVSMGYETGVGFSGVRSLGLGQAGGEFYAWWDSDGWPESWDFFAAQYEFPMEDAREWKRRVALRRLEEPNLHYAFIPCYGPVLGYVAMWTGLLIWRTRKFEKMLIE